MRHGLLPNLFFDVLRLLGGKCGAGGIEILRVNVLGDALELRQWRLQRAFGSLRGFAIEATFQFI